MEEDLEQKIEYYRERAKDESAKIELSYLDAGYLKQLLDTATPGPWHWVVHDYSMATMQGPAEEYDHVCSVSPCTACQDRAKQNDPEWKWGRCTAPTEANANLMVIAPTLAKQYLQLLEQVEQSRKYPIVHESHLYQYGEDVYVWFDEVGLVGGAANTIEQARQEQQAHIKAMG